MRNIAPLSHSFWKYKMKSWRANERGASAVEFALVVPLLLILVIGVIEFGRVFNTQLQLTAAARESVRVMAIQKQPDVARSAAVAAAPGLDPELSTTNVQVSPTSCSATTDVTVTITYSVNLLSGLFADAIPLNGTAVMRCGG